MSQLTREGGAYLIVSALRTAMETKPIQEAVRLVRQLMGLRGLRRESGQGMRKWTSRFEGFVERTGEALHHADTNMGAHTVLHPLIRGIMFLERSQ